MPGREVKFNPNSINSKLAELITRMDVAAEERQELREDFKEAHKENSHRLDQIIKEARITNGRVTILENCRSSDRKYLAGISAGGTAVGGFLLWLWQHLKPN